MRHTPTGTHIERLALTITAVVVLVSLLFGDVSAQAPAAAETTTTSTTSSPATTLPTQQTPRPAQTTTSTSSTSTTVALPTGRCDEWYRLAVDVGWPIDRLAVLGSIMWAESRCTTDAYGTGALGLLQIQYNAHRHWLASELQVTDRDGLYDPETNLRAGLWLAEYAAEHYGCWAQPWYMSGDWC